jgi:hypothetical protein
MRWAYPYRLSRLTATVGDTVQITITGPVKEAWYLVACGDGWDYRAEAGPSIVATVSLTTDQAWRLLSNNLPRPAVDNLDMSGDPRVLDVLRNTRAIIGEPK